jgi:hypothetical protein
MDEKFHAMMDAATRFPWPAVSERGTLFCAPRKTPLGRTPDGQARCDGGVTRQFYPPAINFSGFHLRILRKVQKTTD